MDQTEITLILIGMAVVTYVPRCLPTLFLSGRQLSPLIIAWLRLVPPAILAAMLIPSLVAPQGELSLSYENLFLMVSLVVFPVAAKTRSLSIAVILGMGLVALGRYVEWGM